MCVRKGCHCCFYKPWWKMVGHPRMLGHLFSESLLRLVCDTGGGRQPRKPRQQPLQRVAQRDDPRVALVLERVEVEREAGVRKPQAPRGGEAGNQGG